jgi:hypothetical protein
VTVSTFFAPFFDTCEGFFGEIGLVEDVKTHSIVAAADAESSRRQYIFIIALKHIGIAIAVFLVVVRGLPKENTQWFVSRWSWEKSHLDGISPAAGHQTVRIRKLWDGLG